MEGLSDQLLALRAVLDGPRPGRRVAADARLGTDLRRGGCDRIEARGRVESALELERALMNGAKTQGAPQLAAWLEDGRAAACCAWPPWASSAPTSAPPPTSP